MPMEDPYFSQKCPTKIRVFRNFNIVRRWINVKMPKKYPEFSVITLNQCKNAHVFLCFFTCVFFAKMSKEDSYFSIISTSSDGWINVKMTKNPHFSIITLNQRKNAQGRPIFFLKKCPTKTRKIFCNFNIIRRWINVKMPKNPHFSIITWNQCKNAQGRLVFFAKMSNEDTYFSVISTSSDVESTWKCP